MKQADRTKLPQYQALLPIAKEAREIVQDFLKCTKWNTKGYNRVFTEPRTKGLRSKFWNAELASTTASNWKVMHDALDVVRKKYPELKIVVSAQLPCTKEVAKYGGFWYPSVSIHIKAINQQVS